MGVLACIGLAALGLAWFLLSVAMATSTARRVALLSAAGFYVILWMLTIGLGDPPRFLRSALAMLAVGALAYLFMFRDPTGHVTRSRCFVGAACEMVGGTPDHEHYRDGGYPTVVRGRVDNVPVEIRMEKEIVDPPKPVHRLPRTDHPSEPLIGERAGPAGRQR